MDWWRKKDRKSEFIVRSEGGMASSRPEREESTVDTRIEGQEKPSLFQGVDEKFGTGIDHKSESSEHTKRTGLYPEIHSESLACRPSVSLYPTVQMGDIIEKPSEDEPFANSEMMYQLEGFRLYPQLPIGLNADFDFAPSAPYEATEETLIKIPGAIVHLIDKQDSIELASGEFMLVRLLQGGNGIAVFARVGNEIQWPLAKDEPAVKLGECRYFFSLRVPDEARQGDSSDEDNNSRLSTSADASENSLNYGLTFAARGQASALRELDKHLEQYSLFSVQKVSENGAGSSSSGSSLLDDSLARETAPSELCSAEKKQLIEERSAAYWTTLAPNVEDYSGSVARAIAAGSGHIIKGLLWCGDVTVEQLRWGNEFLKKRLQPNERPSEISPEAMRRMRRAKRISRMSEKVAAGILSGVVKVAGFVTGSVVNSKAGKKFFSLLPGEIVLASLDAFGKVFDAVEVVGKNVLTTSSVVTTGLVSHRYGEQAAELTNEGLGAAGHMITAAWTVSKIRNALNPKNALKPTALAKSAAKAVKKEKQSK